MLPAVGKFLDWLLGPEMSTAATVALPVNPGDVAQVADMPPEVAAAFGINPLAAGPITLTDALRVPAFSRGRDLIAGTGGKLRLRSRHRTTLQTVPRALLDQPNPNTTSQFELTRTIEDLMCYPVAWWEVLGYDLDGRKAAARRIDPRRVHVDRDGVIHLDGVRLADPDRALIRFDSFHRGVLLTGAPTLRAALAIERAVARYADNPRADGYLYDKRDYDPTTPELPTDKILENLAKWDEGNRTNPTRWLNRSTGYEKLTWSPVELGLSDAREGTAVQVARVLNLPNRQVNAAVVGSSMTYSTTMADRAEFLETTLDNYLVCIEQRLSLDDITPPDERVDFDRDAYVLGSAADRLALAAGAVGAQLMDVDEARQRYLNLPPRTPGAAQ